LQTDVEGNTMERLEQITEQILAGQDEGVKALRQIGHKAPTERLVEQ